MSPPSASVWSTAVAAAVDEAAATPPGDGVIAAGGWSPAEVQAGECGPPILAHPESSEHVVAIVAPAAILIALGPAICAVQRPSEGSALPRCDAHRDMSYMLVKGCFYSPYWLLSLSGIKVSPI